jgi:uncharacterized protein YdeI (YjbR/CyaY-like superfamily)
MKDKAAAEPAIVGFASPAKWRAWLAKNHASTPGGVWLRMFKKASGKQSVTYSDALDEALCYGWIDGQVKSYDAESYLQKFTPRRRRSNWSKLNTERVERLIASRRMRAAGLAEVQAAQADGRWDAAYEPPSRVQPPVDFLERLARNNKAQAFFETLSRRQTYPIAYRLNSAKRPETREKRMQEILDMLARGETFYP